MLRLASTGRISSPDALASCGSKCRVDQLRLAIYAAKAKNPRNITGRVPGYR
jgi:hypothetical protein